MPDKNKPSQKPRKHKESKHEHGSGRRFTHTEMVDVKVREKSRVEGKKGRVVHVEQKPVQRDGMTYLQKMLISRTFPEARRRAVLPAAARGSRGARPSKRGQRS